jgi:hypothetical protein
VLSLVAGANGSGSFIVSVSSGFCVGLIIVLLVPHNRRGCQNCLVTSEFPTSSEKEESYFVAGAYSSLSKIRISITYSSS